jgi:hypothetical protein
MNKELLYFTGHKVHPEFIDGLGEVEATETLHYEISAVNVRRAIGLLQECSVVEFGVHSSFLG